jgi:hypothetical protein
LLIQLDEYLLKTNDVFIDLTKCIKFQDEQLELIEPIDVLLNASHLCNTKFHELDRQMHLSEADEDLQKNSESIDAYLDLLKDTFIEKDLRDVYNTYKEQMCKIEMENPSNLINIIKSVGGSQMKQTQLQMTKSQALLTMAPANKYSVNVLQLSYQCLLGGLEALMENYFQKDSYT